MTNSSRLAGPLLLATTNPAKAARLRWVFGAAPGAEPTPLPADAGPGPDEDGGSFRENAELKAQFWSNRYGRRSAASDGGLLVPALGPRWNALRTARMAGPGADDLARAEHLLALAAELRGEQRAVYWVEALAIAEPGALLASWEARGTKAYLVERFEPADLRPGFWAASLCYLPDHGTTLADASDSSLPAADPTWSGLRERVRDYSRSG